MLITAKSIVRLLPFLAVSLALHVALAYCRWDGASPRPVAARHGVVVSLVTATAVGPRLASSEKIGDIATTQQEPAPGTAGELSPPRRPPAKTPVRIPEPPLPVKPMVPKSLASESQPPKPLPAPERAAPQDIGFSREPGGAGRPAIASAGEAANRSSQPDTAGGEVVDATPRYENNPLPKYPYLARQRHWQGRVWLLVTVSGEGRVVDLEVTSSSGYGVLDKSALKTVRRWRFVPAMRGGVPVASQVKIPVEFRLQD